MNADGSVEIAPCGTCKVESALLMQGFAREDVIVAHPDYLEKVIGPATRVLGITENDPLGIGPATSTFHQILGGEPQMKLKFQELLNDPIVLKFKPKIVPLEGQAPGNLPTPMSTKTGHRLCRFGRSRGDRS